MSSSQEEGAIAWAVDKISAKSKFQIAKQTKVSLGFSKKKHISDKEKN
jgi:hypothetical protein